MVQFFEQPKYDVTKDEAYAAIMEIRQEIALMGANDHEMPDIERILTKMDRGICTPTQALEEARAMQTAKMDYH